MNTASTSYNPFGLRYWVAQTLKTRRFGHTYVHVGARGYDFVHDGIRFSYEGYGRSLQGGGHKYKVHARYTDTDKPVPSKVLNAL